MTCDNHLQSSMAADHAKGGIMTSFYDVFLKGLFKQKVLIFILFWFSGGFSSCSPVVGNMPSTKRTLVVDVLR